MALEELLSHEVSFIDDMEKYIKTIGLYHIGRRELDRIIDKFGLVVF